MTITTCTDIVWGALYQRVSMDDQSIARQNDENRAAAARNGWQATEYTDDGLSASQFAGRNGGANREDWRRLLADLQAGRIDVLVLWEASRGDRQLAGWATLLDTCRKHGVLIYLTSEDYTYDVTRARDWKALAEAGISSAMESETLSIRIKSGKDEARRAGRPQGVVPYGIRRVKDPELARHSFLRNEAHPVTGPIAARIVRDVAAGKGYGKIADALNAEAIPPPTATRKKRPATRWSATSVALVAGKAIYAEVGLVTVEESLAARARLADAKRKGERPSAQRFRYSSVIACGVCGAMLRGAFKAGKDKYLCRRGHVSIPAAEVDTWVDALCIERLSRPDLIGSIRQADNAAAAAFRAEAAGYREKIEKARKSYSAGRIEIEDLEAIKADLSPKIKKAERRATDAEIPNAIVGLPDEDQAIVAQRWESLTLSARKAALRVLAPDAIAKPAGHGHPLPVNERVILRPERPAG